MEDIKDLKLTTSLVEIICNYLIKNNQCQDEECDNCIKNQALEIIKLTSSN